MTCKEFFKSKAFKCLAVLLAIVIVCSVFLTICNSLFEVTDADRLSRAISKIYGQTVETTVVEVKNDQATQGDATITGAYKVTSDGNYIIKSTGSGGFSGGTVTCWVVVQMSGSSVSGVGKVVIDSNEGQSYISKVTSSYLNSFSTTYKADTEYSTDNGFVATGASKSSNAICNAVNGAISFVKTAVLGQTSTTTDPFEGFEYTSKINTKKCTFTVEGETVNYTVTTKALDNPNPFTINISVAKNSDGKAAITAFTITDNGCEPSSFIAKMYDFETNIIGKTADDLLALINTADGSYSNDSIDGTLKTGATQSNYLCAAAGLFATANYDKAISLGGNS